MADQSTLLSESLSQSSEQSQLRDPFQMARNQYEMNNKDATSSMLSSSVQQPKAQEALFAPAKQMDFTAFGASPLPAALQKEGIPDKGIPLNELGKVQLSDRLKQKFGDNFSTNPKAMELLKMFDKAMPKQFSQESVSGAQRTLKALLGG